VKVSNVSLGVAGGVALLVSTVPVLCFVALATPWAIHEPEALGPTTRAIGNAFLSQWLLPFELASLVLLATLIGAVVIARKELKADEPDPSVGLQHFLVLGALLFSLGVLTVATRRNAVGVLMGVELILNGANVNFVAFNHWVTGGISGQVFALFVIVLAAAEAAVGLAIVLALFQTFRSIDVRMADTMRE
jgi:NADH-quinone oxidoreductase subunit K